MAWYRARSERVKVAPPSFHISSNPGEYTPAPIPLTHPHPCTAPHIPREPAYHYTTPSRIAPTPAPHSPTPPRYPHPRMAHHPPDRECNVSCTIKPHGRHQLELKNMTWFYTVFEIWLGFCLELLKSDKQQNIP